MIAARPMAVRSQRHALVDQPAEGPYAHWNKIGTALWGSQGAKKKGPLKAGLDATKENSRPAYRCTLLLAQQMAAGIPTAIRYIDMNEPTCPASRRVPATPFWLAKCEPDAKRTIHANRLVDALSRRG